MEAHRRRRLLKALELEVWTPRGVAAEEIVAPPPSRLPTPAAAVVTALPPPRERLALVQPGEPPQPVQLAEPAAPYLAPADWDGLAAAVAGCQRCKLCHTRTKTVFGVGPKTAPLLIVGEGPGADEDRQGEPFVGRAGKLLDEMLRAIGRSRGADTYIANVVKCRPPGNRDPEADEVAACRPFLDRQIELIQPKLIVALGRVAAQRLLGSDAPLGKLRGPLHEYAPAGISSRTPVVVTYHPAYLLRTPTEKAKSWDDLKRVHRLLVAAAT